MRLFSTTTAAIAIAAIGAAVVVPPASAQQPVYPRPMPRSSQGGTDQLRELVDQAPGFEAENHDPDATANADLLLSADDLDELVGPVALYPDKLLAQILVAATHPLDVVQADRLLADSDGLSDDELSVLIAEQNWDPSVMVLMSGFPEVVGMMAADLDWTQDLGDAMLMQDGDVLAAVQRRRTEAYSAGNLVSNEAQQVDRQDGEITIQPTDPERVYVPYYDAQQVYSTPQAPAPAVSGNQSFLANPIVAGALAFGGALLVGQLFGGDDDKDEDDWDDYWNRDQTIDWRGGEVHARPEPGYSWRSYRDRYWDRSDGRWRPDADRDQSRAEARRDAVRWLEEDNEHRDARLKELRARELDARRDALRLEERERNARRRAERLEDQQKADLQAERERKARRAEREQERATKARAEETQQGRSREERRKAERAREEARQQTETDAALQAERDRKVRRAEREKQRAEQASADEREQARARAERRKRDQARQEAQQQDEAEKARLAEAQKKQEEQARKERRAQREAAKLQADQPQKAATKPAGGNAKKQEPRKASAPQKQAKPKGTGKKSRPSNNGKSAKSGRKKCRDGDKSCD